MQQKIYRWKAEIQGFPTVEESASEDITIKSYDHFEILQNLQVRRLQGVMQPKVAVKPCFVMVKTNFVPFGF